MIVSGFVRLIHDINEQPPDSQANQKPDRQAKINTLFKKGKDSGAPTNIPAKRTAAKRGSIKAQRAQHAELAQQAQQAEHAQQSQEAQDVEQAASRRAPDSDPAATDRELAAVDMAPYAPDAEAAARAVISDNGSLSDQGSLSARAARHLSRLNQLPPNELPSPSELRVGKQRRASGPADVSHAPIQLACVSAHALYHCSYLGSVLSTYFCCADLQLSS